VIIRATHLSARTASISDATKRQYAAHNEADIRLLLEDRDYKELHRPRLTAFFQEQVRQRPNLPEEHFLDVVHNAVGIDVLLITGMRDEAPVATFSHLVPESKLIEVRIEVTQETHRARGGVGANKDYDEHGKVIATNHRRSSFNEVSLAAASASNNVLLWKIWVSTLRSIVLLWIWDVWLTRWF
jgi:hypothetical protein